MQDAFGQFKDTEDWRKTNEIDKLYDTIELGDYDETRVLVCTRRMILLLEGAYSSSIHNGPVDETSEACQSTSLKLHRSTQNV